VSTDGACGSLQASNHRAAPKPNVVVELQTVSRSHVALADPRSPSHDAGNGPVVALGVGAHPDSEG